MNNPIRMSAEDLYREEVLAARAMPEDRKLALGLELFDRARTMMLAGIRMQFPEADEATVRQILVRRLQMAREVESLT